MTWKPKEIWDRGVALQWAWEQFATEEEKAEAERIEKLRDPNRWQTPTSIIEGLTSIARIPAVMREADQAQTALREAFEYRLICDLFNEELYGFGYPVHPATIRTPRRIDPTFWDNPYVDWDEGEARIEQNIYNRIRLVDPYKFPDIALGPKSPGPKPLARQQICWAIDHLSKTDKDFWKLTDHIRIFRLHGVIKSNFGTDTKTERGFSEKNFQKYLLEFKKRNISK